MTNNCGQTNIPNTDETTLECNEFISTGCSIHKAAISYLGLEENTTLDVVIEALMLSLIDTRNRLSILEGQV